MTARIALVFLLTTAPAFAQTEGACRGAGRETELELSLRSEQLSPQDRIQAQQRLTQAEGLCFREPPRASQDLDQLRRDIIQQATRPREPGTVGDSLNRY
ncbi:MAG TPA: hypothetical protein VK196_18720 [Magnetospirillum sp.]|nr:hypothetical protein [Magnetospirillum sp.]